MTLGRTYAVALVGLDGHLVVVESHLAASVPAFTIVGLPDASLAEARDRVRAAVGSCGLTWPPRRITVNLSPASLPKAGSSFDLAVAVATLVGAGVVDATLPARAVHLGELGLDGRVHAVRGVLPAVAAAVRSGVPRVMVPTANLAEAELVAGAHVVGVGHLAEVVQAYGGQAAAPPDLPEPVPTPPPRGPAGAVTVDLAEVLGQPEARLALEVAAAGGHHLLLVGPPGAGKTMLASRLPGVLPALSDEEAVEVTSIHSLAGTFDGSGGLMRRPPFEDPHHTATPAAVVGGGSGVPRPGAASRAHRGVLFLDEAPEFSPRVLETLRQPLEHGEVVLHRARGAARYPARFQLVLAANPCPCGRAVGKGLACTCSAPVRRRYLGRLSGPLLDRIDLQVEVLPPARGALEPVGAQGATAAVAQRVAAARDHQAQRLAGTPWRTNAEVSGPWLREVTGRVPAVAALDRALDAGTLSLRGVDRVLRVAWTLADLAGAPEPTRDHVGLALALRTRGHRG